VARSFSGHGSPSTRDRDNDNDNNDDDARDLNYGHAATPAEERSVAGLVRRYYAAAAAGDGAQACRLLVPLTAESVVEDDGRSPSLRGRTCTVVMSKLFKLQHRTLAGKSAALEMFAVRIKGNRGLALLEFPEIHEVRQLGLRRVAGTWRIVDLLDGIIE
jgi:hypothetical protein